MKRLISCAVTFCLAFSMFGVVPLAYADNDTPSSASAQSSSSNATDSDYKEPESDPTINIGDLKDENGNIPQITGTAQIIPDDDELNQDASQDTSASTIEDLMAEAKALEEETVPFVTTPGNEIQGAIVKVTLHTFIQNPQLISEILATLQPVEPADNPTFTALFEAAADETGAYVADFSKNNGRIPQGKYNLSINGPDNVPFMHEVTVENGNRINFSIGDNQENVYLDRYGLLPYGDFDSDNKVTNKDVELLVNEVLKGTSNYDLDGLDGLNVGDLQLFASSLREGASGAGERDELVSLTKGDQVLTVRKDVSNTTINKSAGLKPYLNRGVDEEGKAKIDSEESIDPATFQTLLHETLLGENDSTLVLGTGDDTPINEKEEPLDIEIAATTAQDSTENTVIGMAGVAINYPTESAVEDAAGPQSGVLVVEDENGNITEYAFGNATASDKPAPASDSPTPASVLDQALRSSSEKAYAAGEGNVDVDATNGIIKVDFGTRIAVKKITIRITETTSPDAKLVEIGKVEFLNDMEDLIAPPELNIPGNLNATVGNKQIDVTWGAENNVSGYEIVFSNKGKSVSHTTLTNSFSLREWPHSTFKDVRPGDYTIKVRSISGDWSSAWSEPVTVNVPITERPKRPSNVTVKPGFKTLSVSWPASEDAETYTVYYKESTSTGNFVRQDTGAARSFTIMNLKSGTQYTIYVTASNKIGTSAASDYCAGTTYSDTAVKVPWYKLINRKAQAPDNESLNSHITGARITLGTSSGGEGPAAMYDGRYDTGYVNNNQNCTAAFTMDQAYNMNAIAITTSIKSQYAYNPSFYEFKVEGDDGNGNKFSYKAGDGKLTMTGAGSGAPYTFIVSFPPTMMKNISIFQGRYYSDKVAIAEVAFYESDGIAESIANLWADDVHTTLKPEVTAKQIDDIEALVNTPDADGNDEYTPHKAVYLKELAEARSVLEGLADFRQPKYFDRSVNKINGQPVGGINGWQPLGVAALEDDELKIYVGGKNNANNQVANLGIGTGLKLLICQYNSTPERTSQVLISNMRTGENTVKVPADLTSLLAEHGGQLYVEYNATSDYTFGVRVLGGQDIATLDLHNIKGTADQVNTERMNRINAYVKQLEDQCNSHDERHAAHVEKYGAYNAATCVANTTDIMMDDMMYSVPASQILAGINAASNDKAASLNTSLKSMELMMKLFYQHKGLTNNAGGVTKYGKNNALPTGHQNIRLMRMKEGVFMYAAGNHIGIPFGSTSLTSPRSVEPDDKGKDTDGGMFGWGIAHEIGHEINQGCYTIAEVTNNYYSQLSTNKNPPSTSRYTNASVYNRVTSGTYSPLSGGTGIGCYWQLHLAYDNYYNFKTFDTYAEQMDNLIFARMDAYARNPQSAPGSLSLSGDTSNCLARLACAATQKDLTSYFDAWGLKMDAVTKAYAKQFPKETRPIQYINDAAQDYRIQGGQAVTNGTQVSAQLYVVENGTPREITSQEKVNSRELQLKMKLNGTTNIDGLLGFEVLRNGRAVAFQEVAGNSNFVNGELTFTDKITTENNRAYTYSVRAVDKLLNVTEAVTLPQVKVSDNGTIADKSRWTITTNLVSQDDHEADYGEFDETGEGLDIGVDANEPMPCEHEKDTTAVEKIIDSDDSTVYSGSLPSNGSVYDSTGAAVENVAPYIEIDFGTEKQITAIMVPDEDADAIKASTIQVSTTTNEQTGATEWVTLSTRTTNTSNGHTTFYFDEMNDPQLKVYKASKLRLTGTLNDNKTGGMTLHEVDLIGVTGDNADFLNTGAVGRLDTSVTYAPETTDGENTIPAGTLVFIGSYKGDTAYNALKMRDQDGRLVPGTQVFFAEKPGAGRQLGTTADGRWLWYMTAEDIADYEKAYKCSINDMKSVQLELYRVDDALTLENERHVADTLTLALNDWNEINNAKISLQISSDFNDLKTGSETSQG